MKTLKQQSNACELRLNRSLEDNDKLRNTLKLSQIEGRVSECLINPLLQIHHTLFFPGFEKSNEKHSRG